MAHLLDVPRQKVNEALREIMSLGIVIKIGRGVPEVTLGPLPPGGHR
jgi:hypothetical protein